MIEEIEKSISDKQFYFATGVGKPGHIVLNVDKSITDTSVYIHYSDNLNGYDSAVTIGGVVSNVLNDCFAVLATPLPFHRNWQSLDPRSRRAGNFWLLGK